MTHGSDTFDNTVDWDNLEDRAEPNKVLRKQVWVQSSGINDS